jgi:hypothetical protein
MTQPRAQFLAEIRAALTRRAEAALADPRVALAGAVVLALAHYAFGEWVLHPDLASWRERAFWADLPEAAALPAAIWLLWLFISVGHLNAARPLCLMYAVAFVGDWIWYPVARNASLFRIVIPPDYWYWWTYWLPGVLVVGNLIVGHPWWKAVRGGRVRRPNCQLTLVEIVLRIGALLLAGWALLLTSAHLVVPQLPVNDFTLDMADEFLVRAEQRPDFEFILQNAPCRGKRLGAVLQHVELANLQRHQFYPDLDAATFQQYVLSPIVDSLPLTELDWRRALWENFYPRIRREHEPVAAAQIVVRFLRERVGVSPDFPSRVGVETIWTQGRTDAAGFERMYVAALRSVGIAARLNGDRQAELFAGGQWQPAPRPLISGF